MWQQGDDRLVFTFEEGQLFRRRYGAHQSNAQFSQSLQRGTQQENGSGINQLLIICSFTY